MKKILLNILTVATVITTIGFIMDGDAKEPSMLMRFVEFFMMTAILFTLISMVYFGISFARKSFLKV